MKRNIFQMVSVLFLGVLAVSCETTSNTARYAGDEPAGKIAQAYGIQDFDRLEAIRYTFNVTINEKNIQRSWVWEPATGQVTFQGTGPDGKPMETSYNRKNSNPYDKKIDHWFINDQYWLLFPFHLKWDPGITITEDGIQPLPIGSGSASRISVAYPADEGYTPGDMYRLYYGPDYIIKQWTYHKGGAQEPTRAATWDQHAVVGPITISLMHRGADESFKLWFTDVAVKPVEGQAWVPALIY